MIGKFSEGKCSKDYQEMWDLMEKYNKNPDNRLIDLLVGEIDILRTALTFYAEKHHMHSDWYNRGNQEKCKWVEGNSGWVRGHQDGHNQFCEDGSLAQQVLDDMVEPLVKNKLHPSIK